MSAENIGAMILGVVIYTVTGKIEWIMFPLVLRSFGILATIVGLTSVPFFARDDGRQDPMTPLNYGYYIVSALSVVGLFIATKVMLGDAWHWFFFCGLVGIATGIVFVYITQYYTSGSWRPVKEIAEASKTGPATNIIIGTAVGYETTAATAISIGLALVVSFVLGSHADIAGVPGFSSGVFGTAVATAGLAAFLLFSAYLDKVKERLDIPLTEGLPIDLSNVDVFVGGLLGVMLVFLFSSLAIRAVGNTASAIIEEVRRQFREDPGSMAGTSRPHYARAVDITARAALRPMVAPGLLAVGMPVAVGLIL